MEFLNDLFQPHTVETSRILLSFLFAFFNGCIIYFIYKKTYGGVFKSSGFRISLLLLPLLVTLIILTVVNNLAMSLGMIGALSIARYRTPIKEPLDIFYVLWSISMGVAAGAGFYFTSLLLTSVISLILIIKKQYIDGGLEAENLESNMSQLYLLIVSFKPEKNTDYGTIVNKVFNILNPLVKKKTLKSKFFENNYCEIVCEVDVAPFMEHKIIKQLESVGGTPKLISQHDGNMAY